MFSCLCAGVVLQVVRESIGIGHGELVNGLFPRGGFLRLLGSALVFDVAYHQPKRFQRRSIVRELTPVTSRPAPLGRHLISSPVRKKGNLPLCSGIPNSSNAMLWSSMRTMRTGLPSESKYIGVRSERQRTMLEWYFHSKLHCLTIPSQSLGSAISGKTNSPKSTILPKKKTTKPTRKQADQPSMTTLFQPNTTTPLEIRKGPSQIKMCPTATRRPGTLLLLNPAKPRICNSSHRWTHHHFGHCGIIQRRCERARIRKCIS